MLRAVPAHLAVVGLATGLLPLLIGGAWLAGNLRRARPRTLRVRLAWHVTVLALCIEVGSFDLRFGGGTQSATAISSTSRPLLFVALAAALSAARPPRWSLAAPLAVFVFGVWEAPWSAFEKLNADTPASVLNDWLLDNLHGLTGARWFLTLAAVVVVLLYVEATSLAGTQRVLIGLQRAAHARIAGGDRVRLQAPVRRRRHLGPADDARPEQRLRLDRPRRSVRKRDVMIPYPVLVGDYWANLGYWWDLEFWNRSVTREAWRPEPVLGHAAGQLPEDGPSVRPRAGQGEHRPGLVRRAVAAGVEVSHRRPVASARSAASRSIPPNRPWRADWISAGLYADGWTRPGVRARIIGVRASRAGEQRPAATSRSTSSRPPTLVAGSDVPVEQRHVAARRRSERRRSRMWRLRPRTGMPPCSLDVQGASPIPGDESNIASFAEPRDGGVLITQVALLGETETC